MAVFLTILSLSLSHTRQAHTVLGIFILFIIFTWCSKEADLLPLSRAYRISGYLHIGMGLYLYLWLFYLMSPGESSCLSLIRNLFQFLFVVLSSAVSLSLYIYLTHLFSFYQSPSRPILDLSDNAFNGKLFYYSTSDFLQWQHISISGLMVASGLVEVNFGAGAFEYVVCSYPLTISIYHSHCYSPLSRTHISSCSLSLSLPISPSLSLLLHTHHCYNRSTYLQSRTSHWHALYCVNMMLVGLLFLLHPQQSKEGTALHIYLGLSLVLGSAAFHTSKKMGFPSSLREDWYLVLGGFFYSLAFAFLVFFEEKHAEHHTGHNIECQPAWPLTVGAWVWSLGSSLLSVSLLIYSSCCRPALPQPAGTITADRGRYSFVDSLELPPSLIGNGYDDEEDEWAKKSFVWIRILYICYI